MTTRKRTKVGLHVAPTPSGRFGFVGAVPANLCHAVPADRSALLGGRAEKNERGEYIEWKTPSFATREDALTFAQERGAEVQS